MGQTNLIEPGLNSKSQSQAEPVPIDPLSEGEALQTDPHNSSADNNEIEDEIVGEFVKTEMDFLDLDANGKSCSPVSRFLTHIAMEVVITIGK